MIHIDIQNTKLKDRFILEEFDDRKRVYFRGKWRLSIKCYVPFNESKDPLDYMIILVDSIDKDNSVVFYPNTKKYYYHIKGGILDKMSLNYLIQDIYDLEECVNEAIEIIKKDCGFEFD